MKKLFYLSTLIIQILLIVGSEVFQNYTRGRMGMNRWVSYYNRYIENSYPVSIIKFSLVAILILFTVTAVVILIRSIYLNNKPGILQKLMCISTIIINSMLTYFILSNDSTSNTSYYFVILIISITSLLQFIKLVIYTKINKNPNSFLYSN